MWYTKSLRQLNKHYGLQVRFQSNPHKPIYFFRANKPSAIADLSRHVIHITPKWPEANIPEVLAHEFAHIVRGGIGYLQHHDSMFEEKYKECCLIIGVSYVPTRILRHLIKARIRQNKNDRRA